MTGKLFGTDGIRAVAGRAPLTPEVVVTLGRAVAERLCKVGDQPRVVVGRDTRLSSEMLEAAFWR